MNMATADGLLFTEEKDRDRQREMLNIFLRQFPFAPSMLVTRAKGGQQFTFGTNGFVIMQPIDRSHTKGIDDPKFRKPFIVRARPAWNTLVKMTERMIGAYGQRSFPTDAVMPRH